MAGDALSRTDERISEFSMISSVHSMFVHIYVNEELIASHQRLPDAHILPDLEDMMAAILFRI